jgi:2-polyprenyl-3-methyl-5-hydroxy-6-metoxy-1,4-benzoquinol methylase
MPDSYREQLFENYNQYHAAYMDLDDQSKLTWFRRYIERNYIPYLDTVDRASAIILEIGCGKGYLLATMKDFGFAKLHGIDLSPEDIEKAKQIAPNASVVCVDAFEYLENLSESFDVIVFKAVLEHIQKERVLLFLRQVNKALRPGGIVIVDVPNMDWLFASHERYMDYTHEVGFTRESLAQVMRGVFEHVSVYAGLLVEDKTQKNPKIAAWQRRMIISALNLLLGFIGEGASEVLWHSRSIIGLGYKASKEHFS